MTGCANPQLPDPPCAEKRPHTITVHGDTRVDDYYWLSDKSDPHVIAYLEAENAYMKAVMRHTEALQQRLFKEMKGRIKETDLSVPVKDGPYYYYRRTFEGKQYWTFCRKKGSLDAEEEVILDANDLAAGHDYFSVGVAEVSPDHRLLAYSIDTKGDEVYTLRVKDLTTGKLLPDEIPNTYYDVEWANDNRTLFYNVLDEAKRPHRLYRHRLGEPAAADVLVYEEPDDRFHLGLSKTRSRKYLLLELESQITSEVHVLDADAPEGPFRIIEPRRQKVEYEACHHGDSFYIVTNDEAVNFKLVRAPVESPGRANWTEVIPHRADVKLDAVDAFKDHLVIYEREAGLKTMRIRRLSDGTEHRVEFPEPVYTFLDDENPEFDSHVIRFHYTSLITPRSVYDYDMDERTRELMKRDEVLGGFDPAQYESRRIFASASDGTKIPISMVYRRSVDPQADNPLLLYGYGSYDASMEPFFSSTRVSLLDRGMIFAIAHVRGGGELGRPWYEAGKLLHKKNTFTDFIACAEHLIGEGYTSPQRLVIQGGSAGGLLMGAVTNLRPDLFKAVVAQVPFVDVLTTMLDESIPLTVVEYEEWGNPNEKPYYDYMTSYSPVDNVAAKAYPNILITAGLNDPRVGYWEPAKWAAKLRALKTDDNRLLLKTNMDSGHGGESGRYDKLKEVAFEFAFIIETLGL